MTHKKPVRVGMINDLKIIAQHIADNDIYREEWIETVKECGFDYGKNSLYYLARKSLESNLMGFELKIAKELIESLIQE